MTTARKSLLLKAVGRSGTLLDQLLAVCASTVLAALMLLTFVDVFGRDVFSAPLPGGYELSGLLLFTLFFLGLPLVSARDEHIRVSLLDPVLTDRLRALIASLFTLAASVALLVCSAYVARNAMAVAAYGDISLYLRIPVAPFLYLASVLLALTGLGYAFKFARSMLHPSEPQ